MAKLEDKKTLPLLDNSTGQPQYSMEAYQAAAEKAKETAAAPAAAAKTTTATVQKKPVTMQQGEFKYNVNADPLYQQYKDQYIQGGKLAMMDTMGKAAALTGGYGSTYGQQVGQQDIDQIG